MKKAIARLVLCTLFLGATAAQGANFSSLWDKHGSTALWSLYALGAAAVTYACHKDVPGQVEKLQKPTPPSQSGNRQYNKAEQREYNEALQAYNFLLSRCYAKPVEVAVFFALMGGAVKLYTTYYK